MVLQAPLNDAVQSAKSLAEAEQQPNGNQGGRESVKALDHPDAWAAVETIVRDCHLKAQLGRLGEYLTANAFQLGVFVEKVEYEMLASHDQGPVVIFLQCDGARWDSLISRNRNNRFSDLSGSPLGGKGGYAPNCRDHMPIYDHLGSIEISGIGLSSAILLAGGMNDSDTCGPEQETDDE